MDKYQEAVDHLHAWVYKFPTCSIEVNTRFCHEMMKGNDWIDVLRCGGVRYKIVNKDLPFPYYRVIEA